MKTPQHNDIDKAMFINFNGRGWIVWVNPNNEMISFPEDEKPFDQDDLLALEQYLYTEGFYADYYQSRLDLLNDL
jgi:hypothetical protein